MSALIEIGLKDELGSDLSSRARAASFRTRIIELVNGGSDLRIDLEGVRSVSNSFADELFGVLVRQVGADWFRNHVQLVNIQPYVRDVILEAVEARLTT